MALTTKCWYVNGATVLKIERQSGHPSSSSWINSIGNSGRRDTRRIDTLHMWYDKSNAHTPTTAIELFEPWYCQSIWIYAQNIETKQQDLESNHTWIYYVMDLLCFILKLFYNLQVM